MTDAALLALIRATPALQTLANAGNDAGLAAAVPQYATVSMPTPFTAEQVLSSITTADAIKVMGSQMQSSILASINAQDRTGCAAWASLCVAAGLITTAEQTAISGILNATTAQPDTSVDHVQVSRVLAPLRFTDPGDGATRAHPINW